MNNRIKKFLEIDFGIGGLQNYTPEQAEKTRQVLGLLFSGEFAVTELATIRDLLISLNLDKTSEKMTECIDEVENLEL